MSSTPSDLTNMMDSSSRLPALPAGTTAPEYESKKRHYGPQFRHYNNRAKRIYELRMREHVVRRRVEGADWQTIAEELGQSVTTIHQYHKKAIERFVNMQPWREMEDDPLRPRDPRSEPWRRSQKGPGAGSHVRGHEDPIREPPISGEVLPPPDEVLARAEALRLTQAAVPTAEIADRLGLSVATVRRYVVEELVAIEKSEDMNADLERRKMLLQIDEMIRAIHAPATGVKADGTRHAPVLEAIDRMMKLLKQKSDLLGLHQPQLSDIQFKLVELASEQGYDIEELEEVARDVLAKHRIKLPSRGGTT